MDLQLTPHPAQARCPVTKKPLVDEKGNPVPLFANQYAIRLSGRVIGYVGNWEGAPINLITYLPEWQLETLEAFIRKNTLAGKLNMVPNPEDLDSLDDEEDDDEELEEELEDEES